MEKRTTTIKIGQHDVTIQEITTRDSLAVDCYVPVDEETGMPSSVSMTKVYALAAIRAIDGVPYNPLSSKVDFDAVAEAISPWECLKIVELYDKSFDEKLVSAKNESSGPGSSP